MAIDRLRICVCAGAVTDARSDAEKAATLARFDALAPGTTFDFVPYRDHERARVLRADPARLAEARAVAEPPSPALRDALARADVVLAVDLPFDMAVLAPRLRWVQAVGAGVAPLLTAGLRAGVILTTGAGITADPIAEFAIGRILAHWKHFEALGEQQRAQRWAPLFGRNLAGCTLAIVGFGAIGAATARRAHALGMRVVATRRNLPDAPVPGVDRFFPVAALHAMLGEADAVLLCAPETAETRGMFDASAFAAMRPGAFFCNVARGALVDEPALIAALASGRLGGAAIDVAADEPLSPEDPLWRAPRLAISPHSAASLDGYGTKLWALFHDNLRRFLAGEPMANQVAGPRAAASA